MFFPNLQISSVTRTREFWQRLGFSFDERFSTPAVCCLVLAPDQVAVMLHEPSSFAGWLPGTSAADAHTSTEVLLAFDLPSRAAVDTLVDTVVTLGGSIARPTEDLGFMYTRSFRDLDGHIWEPFYMDAAAAEQAGQENQPG